MASLDQLGVPQELRDRAKMMWLITALGGLWGWVIVSFVWKVEGQEHNEWFQFHMKQNLFVGIVHWIGLVLSSVCIGAIFWLAAVFFCVMAFLAIGKGEDYEAPVIGGMARK